MLMRCLRRSFTSLFLRRRPKHDKQHCSPIRRFDCNMGVNQLAHMSKAYSAPNLALALTRPHPHPNLHPPRTRPYLTLTLTLTLSLSPGPLLCPRFTPLKNQASSRVQTLHKGPKTFTESGFVKGSKTLQCAQCSAVQLLQSEATNRLTSSNRPPPNR